MQRQGADKAGVGIDEWLHAGRRVAM